MKILAGLLIKNSKGQILCGLRNIPESPYYGYLAVPWGRAEKGEDPYETARREGVEELLQREFEPGFVMTSMSFCCQTGDGYRLYLFSAHERFDGAIDLGISSAELANLQWLSPKEIMCHVRAVSALVQVLLESR